MLDSSSLLWGLVATIVTDVRTPVAIVGAISNEPLMSESPSLL
jgi:hypothetical protein